jgi:hypothetical protein
MRSIPHRIGFGVSIHVRASVVGRGTRNVRIGRITSRVISTNPITICSRFLESGVGIRGDICAYSGNLLKRLAMPRAFHRKPGFVVRIIGPGQVDLAR